MTEGVCQGLDGHMCSNADAEERQWSHDVKDGVHQFNNTFKVQYMSQVHT